MGAFSQYFFWVNWLLHTFKERQISADLPTLTIGIPTYNRCRNLEGLLRSIANSAEVLVVNDGSTDKTEDVINRFSVSSVTNNENCGYAASFVTLFEQCRTDYLLVAADDDLAIPSVIANLPHWLQSMRPDFVSTQWKRQQEIYRGMSSCRPITAKELRRAANHAPGLVYNVASCKNSIALLRDCLSGGDEMAATYPQVVVLAHLLAGMKKCYWFPDAPIVEGAALPSGIRSLIGDSYDSASARLRQWQAFESFLIDLPGASEIHKLHLNGLYGHIRDPLPPRLRDELDAGAARHLVKWRPRLLSSVLWNRGVTQSRKQWVRKSGQIVRIVRSALGRMPRKAASSRR